MKIQYPRAAPKPAGSPGMSTFRPTQQTASLPRWSREAVAARSCSNALDRCQCGAHHRLLAGRVIDLTSGNWCFYVLNHYSCSSSIKGFRQSALEHSGQRRKLFHLIFCSLNFVICSDEDKFTRKQLFKLFTLKLIWRSLKLGAERFSNSTFGSRAASGENFA